MLKRSCVSATVILALAVSAPKAVAQDNDRVKSLADSLRSVQVALEHRLDSLSNRIATVDASINSQSVTTNPQQEQALKDLAARLRLVETAGTERYLARVDQLRLRYDAGTEVLDGTIQQLNSLDFAVSFAKAVGNLNALGNPQGYPGFQQRYNQILPKLSGEGNEGLRNPSGVFGVLSDALGGFKNNPMIAAIYSVASLFTSKNIPQSEKKDIHDSMICVISFSAETYADSRAIQADMSQLKQNVTILQTEAETYFSDHLAIIGFSGTYADFLRDKDRLPRTYRQRLSTAFQQLQADTSNRAVTQLGFNTEQVAGIEYSLLKIRDFVVRYEAVLRETSALLDRMKGYGEKYRSTVCPALGSDLTSKLTSFSNEVRSAEEAFERAYTRRLISAEQKRLLFGF